MRDRNAVVALATGMLLLGARATLADKPTAAALEHDIDQLDAAIEIGDAWSDAIPKVVALLGAPSVVEGDRLGWFVPAGGNCYAIQLLRAGDYVNDTEYKSLSSEASDFSACIRLAGRHAKLPPLHRPPKIDVDPLARAVMVQWRDQRYQAIYDAAHPAFRRSVGSAADLAHYAELFAPQTGRFVALGAPLDHAIRNFGWEVSGPAVFAKGTATVAMLFRLQDGKPRLASLSVTLPKAMQAHADPADAAALARRALDQVLAGQLDNVGALADLKLVHDLRAAPEFPAQLRRILHDLGKVRSTRLAEQHDCDGKQCLTFEVDAAGGKASATFTVSFSVSRWELDAFDLSPSH